MSNKNLLYIFGALAIIAIIGAFMIAGKSNNSQVASEPGQGNAMMEDKMEKKDGEATMDDENKPSDNMMKEEGKMVGDHDKDSSEAMMQKSGSYKDYSTAAVEAEQKAGNKVVLFFHAPWCPFCKTADEAFRARASEIPSGVTILKTDYDSNTELKKKYGVTYQHTFVQIDTNENQVTKWNGGDIDNVKKYLK